MMELLICSWSGILLLAILICGKYRFTQPFPLWPLLLCVPAGVIAAGCALFANLFQCRACAVSPEATGVLPRALGYMIGAGLGEEFFKFAGGLLVLLAPGLGRAAVRDADRFLCLVTVGLVFGVTENIWVLGDLGSWNVVRRGFLCIPLHMALSGIQGVAVNDAYRQGQFMPLVEGYLAAAMLHTYYDLLVAFGTTMLWAILLTGALVVMVWQAWTEIPEWAGLPAVPGQTPPELILSRRRTRLVRQQQRAAVKTAILKRILR